MPLRIYKALAEIEQRPDAGAAGSDIRRSWFRYRRRHRCPERFGFREVRLIESAIRLAILHDLSIIGILVLFTRLIVNHLPCGWLHN